MGGRGQRALAGDRFEAGVADEHLHRPAFDPVPPHPGGHRIAESQDREADVLQPHEVAAVGHAVADRFDFPRVVRRAHGAHVEPVGVVVDHLAHLAQPLRDERAVAGGQLADRAHLELRERLLRGLPHVEQRAHRQRPDDPAEVFAGDDGGGVGLFVVAAELGERLVEADPHRHGEPQLLPHGPADLVGDLRPRPEEVLAARHVKPRLVDAERLDLVGVALVDLVDQPGVFDVLPPVGRHEGEAGAFALCLPDRLGGGHAEFFGPLVFGEDDAVTAFRVAAHRHRHLFQLGAQERLHRGVKGVAVAVQDHAVHEIPSRRLFVQSGGNLRGFAVN